MTTMSPIFFFLFTLLPRFLLQCLEDLDRNLRQLNSRLFVIRGQPADALPKLFKEWGTTCLTFEEDPEPFGKVRDHNISEMCKELNIDVISAVSHTLYKLERLVQNGFLRIFECLTFEFLSVESSKRTTAGPR